MRFKFRLAVFAVMAFLMVSCSTLGTRRMFVMDEPIPVSNLFIEKKLDNGLTYYIRTNTEPENRVRLMLVVRAGRVLEGDGQLGAAHYVEHMAFNGTKHFPGKGIDRFMESVGMGTCECYSGYTTFDETVYSFWLPTEDIETLDRGFMVLADIANEVSFIPEEIEKERGVLVEEWREGKGRSRENSNRILRLLYEGSRYADRLTSNEKSFAESLDGEQILNFYLDWYRPDLMAVIAVGDFDEKAAEKLIHKHFAHLAVPEGVPRREEFKIPDHEGTSYLVVSDPDAHAFSIRIMNLMKPVETKVISDYRNEVMMQIYLRMLNARLGERLLDKDPLYLGASAYLEAGVGDRDSLTMSVSAEEGHVREAVEAMFYEVGRVINYGFTESEFRRVKAERLNKLDNAEKDEYDSSSTMLANEFMRRFLSAEPIPGLEAETRMLRQFLSTITLEEVNALGDKLSRKDNRIIIVSAPSGKESEVPGEEEMTGMLAAMGTGPMEKYVDNVVDAELLPSLPKSGKVVSTKRIKGFGAFEWKLSNGATVVLKPTDFEGNEVLMTVFSHGGHSLVDDDEFVPAATASSVVVGGGVGGLDLLSLGKVLTGKNVSVVPYIKELEEGFSGSATPEDLETMFKLLYLYFTSPRKDEIIFETLKKRTILSVEMADKLPEKKLMDLMAKVMFGNHPRRVPWDAGMVEQMSLDKSLEIYSDRFSDASDFNFFVVGSFDPKEIRPLVERYVASLPSTYREETWQDVGVELPKGVLKHEVRTGTEEKASVVVVFTGEFQWDPLSSLEVKVLADVLKNRLRESLRENMSGTYGVNVSSSSQRFPKETYNITISFNCNPERVEQLTQALFSEIETLRVGEDLDDYVEPILSKLLKAHENRLKENSYWMKLLAYLYKNSIAPEKHVPYEQLLERVTPTGVAGAARSRLNLDNYVYIVYYSGT